MPFSQIKDLLRRTADYHRRASVYYKGMEHGSKKEAVRLVAAYLADQERFLEREMKRFLENDKEGLNVQWVQYEPAYDLERVLDGLCVDPEAEVEEFASTALELNRRLITFFHRMAKMAPSDEIRSCFQRLEENEVQAQRKLAEAERMY